MAKKTFKDLKNPAMSFISMPEEDAAPVEKQEYTHNTDNTYNTDDLEREHKTKKSPRSGQKEAKSKRLNLLLWPSLHADLEKIAYVRRCSVNDLINQAMKEYAEAHQAETKKYDEFVNN